MQFRPHLRRAKLLRRYQRFLADMLLDGEIVTVHCPNTGSMKHCLVEGSDCWLSVADNPRRKYPLSWELASAEGGGIACINTQRANALVEEALRGGWLRDFGTVRTLRRECALPGGGRIDFVLDTDCGETWLEVKSVTMHLGRGVGAFPDAQSLRAGRHLRELTALASVGKRAALLYCVLHTEIRCVRPAADIDPSYASLLAEARAAGVQVLAYACQVSPLGLTWGAALPVESA